jgi:gliding motility-associated protein GldE
LDPEPIILLITLFETQVNAWLIASIIILFTLLFISALISGSEVAFFSLSQRDLYRASESKKKKEKIVTELLEKPQKLLTTILIFNNFINILIVLLFAFIGEFIFKEISPAILRFLVEVVIVSFLILLFGEVLPKVYVSRNPLKFAIFLANPLKVLNRLLNVISLPLMGLTKTIENKLGKKHSNISVEKLSQALELTSDKSTTQDEQKILKGIVNFGSTDTSQIMTPRIDIFAISKEESFKNVIDSIIEQGFSRNPVYGENIDDIIGVLYAKDLLPYLNEESFAWQKLIRKPYFVPENKKLDDLLNEFQEKKNHLAIVVDEYGGTSGIISLEDVIEEIVGDISDEFDDDDVTFTKIDNQNYIFEGKTSLKDFYKILAIEDDSIFEENKGESETIAGFILEVYGKFPKKKDIIKLENYTFKIEAIDKRRIRHIKVTIHPEI